MTGLLMSRTYRRAGLGGLVAALAVLGLAVPAWAYFSVGSTTATAAGRAATLGTPSAATSNISSSAVTVTVTAPTSGPTPTGYRVARTSPTTAASVCTVTGANGSCTDAAPVAGSTNTYAVYAVLSGTSWESPTPAMTSAVVPSADTTPPSVTLTAPANNSSLNSTTPTLSGAAGNVAGDLATVTVMIYNGSGTAGTVAQTLSTSRSGASWSVAAASLAEGTYTAQATQLDAAGNVGTSSANTFVIDTTVPAVTITSPASGSSVNTTTPSLGGAAGNTVGDSPTVTVRIYSGSIVTGSPVQTLTPNRVGAAWTVAAGTLSQGTYTAQATQTDSAGNTGTSPTATTFTVDTVAPSVTLTSPASNTTTSTTPTLSGGAGNSGGDLVSVTVKIYRGTGTAGALEQSLTATRSGTSWTVTSPTLAGGTYTAQASQTDIAGNTGTSLASTFTVDAVAPSVTNVVLGGNNGTAGKDDTVTITYSEPMDASSFCPTWTGASGSLAGNNLVTVKIADSGTSDVLTVAASNCAGLNIGAVNLNANYVTADTTFSGTGSNASTVSLSASGVLTITLGSPNGGNVRSGVAAAAPTYTPSSGLKDLVGNLLPTTSFTGGSTRF